MMPLNQSYQKEKTFKDYPEIRDIKQEYEDWCLNKVKWNKYGRSYDCAMSLYNVDFKDKTVCELGARDSLFCAYLTDQVKEIRASDTFMGWGDLGDINFWRKKWEESSFDKNKLVVEFQDMRKLSYTDEYFDVVVSFSAIEHIPNNGDILAAREMGRVCKKGGTVIIGTDISDTHKWESGGYFYDTESLKNRIINNTGCELIGDCDFDFNRSEINTFNNIKYSSVIFFLRK